MSRIGKKPVPVGAAKITVNAQNVKVEGPKGKLDWDLPACSDDPSASPEARDVHVELDH